MIIRTFCLYLLLTIINSFSIAAKPLSVKDSSLLEILKHGETYFISVTSYSCFSRSETYITVMRTEVGYSIRFQITHFSKFIRKENERFRDFTLCCIDSNDLNILKRFESQVCKSKKNPVKFSSNCPSGMWSRIKIALNEKTIDYIDENCSIMYKELFNYFCQV
jgi:hypothetical protein